MSNINNYQITYTKQLIIKTILYKSYNKIYILDFIYCKLFTSVPDSNFYYSGLEGALVFFYNFEENNFVFVLYDLNNYDLLFKININSVLIIKNVLIPLKNNFLMLEVNGGFIGFLFPNLKEGEKFINKIKDINGNFLDKYMIEYKKLLNNKNDKNKIIEKLKNKHKKILMDNNNIQLNINNENLIYNNNLKVILNCLDYNIEKNKFIFNGEKNLFNLFIKENNIFLDKIDFFENDSFTIQNKKHFINILINHFITDLESRKKLNELTNEYNLKINNYIKKTRKRHLSTNLPNSYKIINRLKKINSINNNKPNSSKNVDYYLNRFSVMNLKNKKIKIDKIKEENTRLTVKPEMKIIKEINKNFHNLKDTIIPGENEDEDEDEYEYKHEKNPFIFSNVNPDRDSIDENNNNSEKVSLIRKSNSNKIKEKNDDKIKNKILNEISKINIDEMNYNNNDNKNIKEDNKNKIFRINNENEIKLNNNNNNNETNNNINIIKNEKNNNFEKNKIQENIYEINKKNISNKEISTLNIEKIKDNEKDIKNKINNNDAEIETENKSNENNPTKLRRVNQISSDTILIVNKNNFEINEDYLSKE